MESEYPQKPKNLNIFKSLFLIFIFLFLVFGSFVVSQKSFSSNLVLAAKSQVVEPTPLPTLTPTPTPVDYYLVYPGILPDHFLYPLKMIRDRFWLILTTGPRRKAEVMLLFADKRLGAGKALIEGGKERLGVTTLSKGEKYLEQAVGQLQLAQKKGQEIPSSLKEKFLKAVGKHREILEELKKKVGSEEGGVIDEMLTKLQFLRGKIEDMKN